MLTVKCTYSNNDEIITDINTDLEGAKKYFLNKLFNLGSDSDNIQRCIKVEEL